MKHKEIHRICKEYEIENYTINGDGSIDVNGNVYLFNKNLTKLPLRFNKVSGYFNCCFNKLTTLKGAPKEVGGDFYCRYNRLKSLKHAPLKVGDNFECHGNIVNLDYNRYKKSIERINKIKEL